MSKLNALAWLRSILAAWLEVKGTRAFFEEARVIGATEGRGPGPSSELPAEPQAK